MKLLLKVFSVVLLMGISKSNISAENLPQNVAVSYQVFYDELSPYGYWVDYPSYGYVWVPNVGPGFYPYSTGGHWVYTNYGWTWVSDYAWGWAPFHYGRWDYDNSYGWLWVPSYEWGPAWVSWRHTNGYYGWAPLTPNVTVVNSFRGYEIPADRWRFVRERDINRSNIHKYYINRNQNATYLKNSTVITNTYVDKSRGTTYVYGPRKADVQRKTNTVIKPVNIRNNSKPGQRLSGNQLTTYRPQIQTVSGSNAKPALVSSKEDIKPGLSKSNTNVTSADQNNPLLTPKTSAKPKVPTKRTLQPTSKKPGLNNTGSTTIRKPVKQKSGKSNNPLLAPTQKVSKPKTGISRHPRSLQPVNQKPTLNQTGNGSIRPAPAQSPGARSSNNPLLNKQQVKPAPRQDNTRVPQRTMQPSSSKPSLSGSTRIPVQSQPAPARPSGNPILRQPQQPAPARQSGNPLLKQQAPPAPAQRRSDNPLLRNS